MFELGTKGSYIMREIVLGSESQIKIAALRKACGALALDVGITAVETDSGQPPQPDGFNQILDGAMTRATGARSSCVKPDCLAVGIENGLVRHNGVAVDLAIIVVLDGERTVVTTSQGIMMPSEVVKDALAFNTTVGALLGRRFGAVPDDPHSYLTQHATSREKLLTEALITALRQL